MEHQFDFIDIFKNQVKSSLNGNLAEMEHMVKSAELSLPMDSRHFPSDEPTHHPAHHVTTETSSQVQPGLSDERTHSSQTDGPVHKDNPDSTYTPTHRPSHASPTDEPTHHLVHENNPDPTHKPTHEPTKSHVVESSDSSGSSHKIVCCGDSITWGYGASSPQHSYPANLGRLLGNKYIVKDYGEDGVTAQKVSGTREGSYWHTKFYRWALDFLPDIVIIMLGTNDSKHENWHADLYRRDLADLVQSFLDLESAPRVYLMIPPRVEPTEGVRHMHMQADVIRDEIPSIIKKIVNDKGIHSIDLSLLFQDPTDPDRIFEKGEIGYWTGDGVHPNDDGYVKFAKYVYDHLNRRKGEEEEELLLAQ